jgi:hypothetical protein
LVWGTQWCIPTIRSREWWLIRPKVIVLMIAHRQVPGCTAAKSVETIGFLHHLLWCTLLCMSKQICIEKVILYQTRSSPCLETLLSIACCNLTGCFISVPSFIFPIVNGESLCWFWIPLSILSQVEGVFLLAPLFANFLTPNGLMLVLTPHLW